MCCHAPVLAVTCRHGDACISGAAYEGIAPASIDAIIFDLPQPWDAVVIASPLLRPGGRLCCFSPCIEQIARTMDILPAAGFTGAEVIEVITRTHDVREAQPPQRDALATIAAAARASAAEYLAAMQEAGKNGEAEDAGEAGQAGQPDGEAAGGEAVPPVKRPRQGSEAGEGVAEGAVEGVAAAHSEAVSPPAAASAATPPLPASVNLSGPTASSKSPAAAAAAGGSLITKPYGDMRGHTGFLLFCSKHVG